MYELRTYHGDKVQSLTYDDGKVAFSVGIISPGEYQFGSIKEEIFKVNHGLIYAWSEGDKEWKAFNIGETFVIPASKNFSLKVETTSAYICHYR